MAEQYWTHCIYCGAMICGVEVLEDYPDVVVLYAHKTCHERHTDEGAISAVSARKDDQRVHTDIQGHAGPGRTDVEIQATNQEFC